MIWRDWTRDNGVRSIFPRHSYLCPRYPGGRPKRHPAAKDNSNDLVCRAARLLGARCPSKTSRRSAMRRRCQLHTYPGSYNAVMISGRTITLYGARDRVEPSSGKYFHSGAPEKWADLNRFGRPQHTPSPRASGVMRTQGSTWRLKKGPWRK